MSTQESTHAAVHKAGSGVSIHGLIKGAWIVSVVFLVFGGTLRWFASSYAGSAFVYSDKAVMAAALLLSMCVSRSRRHVLFIGTLYTILILYVIIGIMYTGNVAQHTFALWVYLPLVFSAVTFPFANFDSNRMGVAAFWFSCLVALGVILDSFLDFPWTGYAFDIGDQEVVSARLWWATGNVERLAGFSRASFEAAAQLAILALVVHALTRKRIIVECIYFAFVTYAIYLTTTKRVLFAYGACVVLLVICRCLRSRSRALLLRSAVLIFGMVGIFAPIVAIVLGNVDYYGDSRIRSLGVRFSETWPEALSKVSEDWMIIVGRGLGGVGTPSLIYAPSDFILTDNMFLHLFGIGGIFGGLVYVVLVAKISLVVSKPSSSISILLVGVLSTFLFLTGIAANNLQSTTYGILVGIIVAVCFAIPSRPAVSRG